jgi:hypothetical protein
MYHSVIRQFAHSLRNLDAILEKAQSYAKERGFDPNVFTGARLAPDMLPFTAQIRIACDSAKHAAASLSGKENPRHEDNETTFEELRGRVSKCLAFVDSVSEADVATLKADALVTVPGKSGKKLRVSDYVLTRQLPNFYFHLTTAYALLRHNGVPIGKADFLGALPFVEG